MKKILRTVICPTFPLVLVLITIALTLSFVINFIYPRAIFFNPAACITEIIRTTFALTFLFWLIEYQKKTTEDARNKYKLTDYVNLKLLLPLATLLNILVNLRSRREASGVDSAKKQWLIFHSAFNEDIMEEISEDSKALFIDIRKEMNLGNVNEEFAEMTENVPAPDLDMLIKNIQNIIKHVQKHS